MLQSVRGKAAREFICEPRDSQIGGFPLPPFLGRKYPAPAPPEMWLHAREKSYAAYADSNRTFIGLPRSIRTLHHWRISAMRGNGRYLRSSRVKKYPRATPLAIAGLMFALVDCLD